MKCKVCGNKNLVDMLTKDNVPVFQNMKYKNYNDAINIQCGRLDIKLCNVCGMAHNTAFNEDLVDYSQDYENSQFNSAVYSKYIDSIIDILVNKYNICNANIVEIGCGDARFLKLLSNKSQSKGFGFDPSSSQNYVDMGGGNY